MSLCDDRETQTRRIEDARDVYLARMRLLTLYQHSDEDIRVACARLQNWLDEQPDYVQRVVPS
jgi:hypothetical protein